MNIEERLKDILKIVQSNHIGVGGDWTILTKYVEAEIIRNNIKELEKYGNDSVDVDDRIQDLYDKLKDLG